MNAVAPLEAPAPKSAYKQLRPVLRRFVDAYIAGEKATLVVRKLRPNLRAPEQRASKWLRRPDVQAAIAERSADLFAAVGVSQASIVREMARVAFGDPRRLYDAEGNLIPVHKLDDEAVAMIAGVETVEANEFSGEGATAKRLQTLTRKVKRWDKRQALKDLAELAGMKREDNAPLTRIGPGLTVVVQQGVEVHGQRVTQAVRVSVDLPKPQR